VRRRAATPVQLGMMHALVDTAPALLLFGPLAREHVTFAQACHFILLYNCLAFGLQLPLGWLADSFRAYKTAACVGLIACAAAFVLPGWGRVALVSVSIGNALFHVGGGALVMERSGGRATEMGIFVAPGAVGVLLGIWLSDTGTPAQAGVALALMACAIFLFVQRMPALANVPSRRVARCSAVAGVALLALVVVVRSLLGGAIAGAWRSSWTVTVLLGVAAVAGKVLGGVLADRIGYRVVAVGALLATLLIVHFTSTSAPAGAGAICLVQMTMAVTLAAAYRCFPARPATVFGLFSAMLLVGALPGLTGLAAARIAMQMSAALIGITAFVLLGGLGLCAKRHPEPAVTGQDPLFCVNEGR